METFHKHDSTAGGHGIIPVDDGHSCLVVDSEEALEGFRDDWEKLSKHPNASWEYFRRYALRNEIVSPLALLIRDETGISSIIAGYIKHSSFPVLKFGYRPIISLPAKTLIVPLGCVMGNIESVDHRRTLSLIREVLDRYRINIAYVHFVDVESELYRYYAGAVRNPQKHAGAFRTRHFRIDLGKERESFAKNLDKYRRRSKTPDKFPFGDVSVSCFRNIDELDGFIRNANEISSNSLKAMIGHPFILSPEKIARYTESSANGGLYCYLLAIDGAPRAFLIMYIHNGVCYFDQTGYDADFKYCSPGSHLLIRALYDALEVESLAMIDLDPGEVSFKSRLTKTCNVVDHIVLYADRAKPRALKLFIGILAAVRKLPVEKWQERIIERQKRRLTEACRKR